MQVLKYAAVEHRITAVESHHDFDGEKNVNRKADSIHISRFARDVVSVAQFVDAKNVLMWMCSVDKTRKGKLLKSAKWLVVCANVIKRCSCEWEAFIWTMRISMGRRQFHKKGNPQKKIEMKIRVAGMCLGTNDCSYNSESHECAMNLNSSFFPPVRCHLREGTAKKQKQTKCDSQSRASESCLCWVFMSSVEVLFLFSSHEPSTFSDELGTSN